MNHIANQMQHRRLRRRKHRGHKLIGAVHRQRVLCQIIGADTEKVALHRQQDSHQRRTGRLNHNPNRYLRIVRHRILIQILHHIPKNHLRLPQLLHRRYQRKHQANIPQRRRPQNRPQLRLEQRQILKTIPNRSKPQHRVGLVRMTSRMRQFIRSQIHRPDYHRPAAHHPDHLRIRLIVVLFRRLTAAVQIQKLRPIQPDSLAPFLKHHFRLIRKLHIAQQRNRHPVPRNRRNIPKPVQFLFKFNKLPGIDAVFLQRGLIRIDNHHPPIAVHDNQTLSCHTAHQPLQGHHRRNPQRTGDNRRMARPPSPLRRKALDKCFIETGRLSRRQVMGNNHHLFLQMFDFFGHLPQQMSKQTPLNIIDIRRPLTDIGIVHLLKMSRNLPQNLRDGVFRRHKLFINVIGNPL